MDSVIEQFRKFQEICEKYRETDKLLFQAAQKLTDNLAKSYPNLNIWFGEMQDHYYIHNKELYLNGSHVCTNRAKILIFAQSIQDGLLEKIKC